MEKLLEDKNKTVREDPTMKLERTNNNIVQELYKNNNVTKWERSKLVCNSALDPQLYGLPKIHKDKVLLRPISSSTKVPCYNLSKFIGNVLKTLTSSLHTIRNSMEVKERIRDVILENYDILVSFDVVSLFTNIPTHLAIKNIMSKWEHLKEHTKMTKQMFLKIMQLCLIENNYFKYEKKIYHQTYSMPMGNPLSPTIANIVLDTLLDEVLGELRSRNIEIKFLTKYVDDLLGIIKKQDEQEILRLLNTYHTKIQFTLEREVDGEIPFLDMKIIYSKNRNHIKIKQFSTFTYKESYSECYSPQTIQI